MLLLKILPPPLTQAMAAKNITSSGNIFDPYATLEKKSSPPLRKKWCPCERREIGRVNLSFVPCFYFLYIIRRCTKMFVNHVLPMFFRIIYFLERISRRFTECDVKSHSFSPCFLSSEVGSKGEADHKFLAVHHYQDLPLPTLTFVLVVYARSGPKPKYLVLLYLFSLAFNSFLKKIF